jgi:hypothetical protein
MIASTSHQDWLFYFPLAQQAALLKDDLLDPVDQLLEDPALVDLVRQCLATRSPFSKRTGRTGIAPDRLLRCCVMKHLKGWSFRDLERELRSNLVYRRFTHFDAEATPDFTTFSRTFALLSTAVTEEIHQRVVSLACEQGLQRLLTHSFSGKVPAVRRVTENTGKKTPGVDQEIWDTPWFRPFGRRYILCLNSSLRGNNNGIWYHDILCLKCFS